MYARALDLSILTGQNKFFSVGQTGQIETEQNRAMTNSVID